MLVRIRYNTMKVEAVEVFVLHCTAGDVDSHHHYKNW